MLVICEVTTLDNVAEFVLGAPPKMKLAKFERRGFASVGIVQDDAIVPIDLTDFGFGSLSQLLSTNDPAEAANNLPHETPVPLSQCRLLPPIDRQEVWATESSSATTQESYRTASSAASCYGALGADDRPDLFLKATAARVRGHQQPLSIRSDATWNVSEPEIALVCDPQLRIVGYTIANDVTARDLEAANPLYRAQAKIFDACAGLGPWITLASAMPPIDEIQIEMVVVRGERRIFEVTGQANLLQRSFEQLVSWLGRENSFADGVILMTGSTAILDREFQLQQSDQVSISIQGIGTLTNTIQ